jgi:hypothetical protein
MRWDERWWVSARDMTILRPLLQIFPGGSCLTSRWHAGSEEWNRRLATRSGGSYAAIESDHFIQWHHPQWLAEHVEALLPKASNMPSGSS